MLYEFKCRATGPVVMFQPVAERLLGIIGKAPGPKGVVTPDQMPAAIAALRAAVAQERAQAAAVPDEADEDDEDAKQPPPITLAQRAAPLIEMFEQALAADREITWGV